VLFIRGWQGRPVEQRGDGCYCLSWSKRLLQQDALGHSLRWPLVGGTAEFEGGLIRKRCEEGIERAKAKGTQFGRPTRLDPSQRRRIAERYAAGETMADLAREYECGEATIWRALQPEITAAA
jgi:hypothetical protein